MGKLAPPLLEGTIPAFYSENGIAKLAIPFSMNRAVSKIQVKGISIKIKTIQGTVDKFLGTTIDNDLCYLNLENSPYLEYNIPDADNLFNVGQFYKVQLAYIDTQDNAAGYYSTVAIAKYTSKPELSIDKLQEGVINSHVYEYRGVYRQTGDPAERVYSYHFDIYDPKDNLIISSPEYIHNHDNDIELNESYDNYVFPQELLTGDIYKIKYTITTINKLTLSTPRYRIMQKPSINPEIKAALEVSLNYDNGYIQVRLDGEKVNGIEDPVSGAFLLSRACEDSNYQIWDEITRFKLTSEIPSRQVWKDFTVEQGKTYRYSLQQYNDRGLYSNRMYSDYIYSDFEDAFLFDGEKQLKIKYNPRVSSFKTNLLETKTNTIGSKHPYIFRNGKVSYNEFPISGLVSYQMDEENLFMKEEEYLLSEKTTNLVSENIASERIFKMKVLEWLTNGKPKVFRSPGEGNFIVYLMNTSLSPNDTVGRMLHSFSTTASEVAEYNYKNLSEMNFISLKDPEVAMMRWETVPFFSIAADGSKERKTGPVNNYEALTARINDVAPGEVIYIRFAGKSEYETIKIGVTGSYYIDLGMNIREIKTDENFKSYNASVTYSYKSIQSNVFDKIEDVIVTEIPTRQFIGEHDIIKEIEQVFDGSKWIKNPKIDIIDIYRITIRKRAIEKLVRDENGNYYRDKAKLVAFDTEAADPYILYAIGNWIPKQNSGQNPGYRPGYNSDEFEIYYYMDFYNNKEYDVKDYEPFIKIDKEIISVNELETYQISSLGRKDIIMIGNGAMAEISYQKRNIDFRIELDETYPALAAARNEYLTALNNLNAKYEEIKTGSAEKVEDVDSILIDLKENVNKTYTSFIIELVKAQEEEKRSEGLVG